ncbi:Cysteine-rich domain-containing protein [Thermodesulfobium acidiphilum]|uniref:Cysteine-rich domain-containing protein n=1 Tax=Thermodesulfobium acidiphilum TaxID=1794699 RepID=A0A2R4VZ44_THEAF|nr:(Fe-S)-binding protein [Thermodesulfobium acidiphilum]AWB09813.1 Cysteine-rich domain-containing protein [Thermodesulfobium acidiphilum]
MSKVGAVLGILNDNFEKRKTVFSVSEKSLTSWAKDLDIKRGTETIIYTGHMYQLMPITKSATTLYENLEDSPLMKLAPVGRIVNKFVNLSSMSKYAAKPERNEVERSERCLQNIYKLLKYAGVEAGYLYEDELYVGTLLYDNGIDEPLINQAKTLNKILKDNNVKNIITVDPHTTHMLRRVYKKILPEFNYEVKNYIEVLYENKIKPQNKLDMTVAIHDSCVLARYEEIIEEPRVLLKNAGINYVEPELSRKLTHCCGGPIESLFPKKAKEIASKRANDLLSCSNIVTTMCPICLLNLKESSPSKDSFLDLSEILVKSYLQNS